MSFYNYEDLPQIPEHLIKYVYEAVNGEPRIMDRERMLKLAEEKHGDTDYLSQKTISYSRYSAPVPLVDYVHTFFKPSFQVCVQQFIGPRATRTGIHTDWERRWVYNYIIEQGGDAVTTNFYDCNRNLIDSVIFEPFKWHKIDAAELHNVSGLPFGNRRLAITVFEPL